MATSGDIKAGQAYIEITTENSKLVRGLKAAQQSLREFSAGVSDVGKKTLLLGLAMASPLLLSAKVFSEWGDSFDKMSGRTGMMVESLSELSFAAHQSGTDMETVERAVKFMQRTIGAAATGSTMAQAALAKLGLTVEQLQNLSPDEQFNLIASALKAIDDPTMRVAAAMKIFGKTGSMLLPMIRNLDELRSEARSLGLVMSTEDARASAELHDAISRLTQGLKMLTFQTGAALAPFLQKLAKYIQNLITFTIEWIRQNQSLIIVYGMATLAVMGLGAALLALGGAIKLISVVFGTAATLVKAAIVTFQLLANAVIFLISPWGLVAAAIAGAIAAVGYFAYTIDNSKSVFGEIKDIALTSFDAIKNALAAGDWAAAAKVLWLGIKLAWMQGIQPLEELWAAFKNVVADSWSSLWWGMVEVFDTVIYGIQYGWNATMKLIGDSFNDVIGWMMKKWIQFKGLFDSDINVDAEIAQIDRENTDRQNKRQQELDTLTQQHEATRNGIGRIQNQEEADNATKASDEIDRVSKELEDAKKAWQEAVDEAKAATPPAVKEASRQLESVPIDEITAKTTIQGSFYADALRSLSAGGAADRTAKATEEISKNTKKTNQILQEQESGDLEFE